MNKVTIQLLKDFEVECLKNLAETIWPSTYQNIISQEQMLYMINRAYNPNALRNQITQGGKIWIAKCNEQPIGYSHIQPESPDKLKLDKLYVLSEFQNQGVGKSLMDTIDLYAASNSQQRIVLRVNKLNSIAIKAYLKYGYQITSSVIQDIGNGFAMDDYIMEKTIPH